MREFSVEEELKRTMEKMAKKDPVTYRALLDKMDEILTCAEVNHYKNLRRPLQHLKRVHVRGPFVLTFRYVEAQDKVVFYALDHHDKIYL